MNNIFVIDKTTKCNLGVLDFTPRIDDRISMKASEGKEIEVVVECVLYEPLEHATLVFVNIVEPYYTALVKAINGNKIRISLERMVDIMRLAVTWEMAGYVDVEADTLEDAMEKFKKECDYIKLPNGNYVDGSFRLSTEDVDEMEAIVDF